MINTSRGPRQWPDLVIRGVFVPERDGHWLEVNQRVLSLPFEATLEWVVREERRGNRHPLAAANQCKTASWQAGHCMALVACATGRRG